MKSLHVAVPLSEYRLHPEIERLARALRGLATPSGLRATAVGLVGVAVASAAIGELDGLADVPSAVMLYLLPILFVGGRWGTAPAVVSAVAAFLLHDFFHVEPVGSLWHTGKAAGAFDLILLLVVAVATGRLASGAREAAGKAREAELRATLLASISHDLRTPLTTIKTSVSSLRDPATQMPWGTERELLAGIEAESDRLVHLVGNVLALSRLEAGVNPIRDWNAIGEIVATVVERCLPVLGDRQVHLDVPDDLPLVRIDPTLLDLALTNLLENAGSHTPPGTEVSIHAERRKSEIRIEVSDSGPGIPPRERDRLFKPFERGRSVRSTGTGLGLAIARAATERQGGTLRLAANTEGGAHFVMLLPCQAYIS